MYRQTIPLIGSYQAWRDAALRFVSHEVKPEHIAWSEEGAEADLFGAAFEDETKGERISVPAAFVDAAKLAICHSDPERFALLYGLLWRLRGKAALMADHSDPQVAGLRALAKSVGRDAHKMKAFLRFQEVEAEGTRRRFAAWFEPEHNVTEYTGPFFARRFADMDWVIATPRVMARFVDGELTFTKTVDRPAALPDVTTELWRTYYASIFNPARLKIKAMTAEMPKKYWKNLPEAALIPELIAHASERVASMRAAMPTVPDRRIPKTSAPETCVVDGDLLSLRHQAFSCTRCDLCKFATQTVFGEGPEDARLMLVGEQPGDREDLEGRAFVGPAGQLLDRAMAQAGIERASAYLTNAVKHFKFEPRGKFRLHKSPDRYEVEQCRWWVKREVALVNPSLIIALGATAALSLTGSGAGVLKRRGTIEKPDGLPPVFLTVHPSSVLRSGDARQQEVAFAAMVEDLTLARAVLEGMRAGAG